MSKMKKKAAEAEKQKNPSKKEEDKNNSADGFKKKSLDAIIKSNTEERKTKFMHYIIIVRYALALFVLFAGIILRYVGGRWKGLSSALIIVGALMLFIASVRLISIYNLPIGEKALLSEIRSERLAISVFFIYIFIMLISYWVMPADLDIYLVLGYGAAIVPISYLISYKFFYKTEQKE